MRRRGEEGSRGVGEHACTKDKVSCSPEKKFHLGLMPQAKNFEDIFTPGDLEAIW